MRPMIILLYRFFTLSILFLKGYSVFVSRYVQKKYETRTYIYKSGCAKSRQSGAWKIYDKKNRSVRWLFARCYANCSVQFASWENRTQATPASYDVGDLFYSSGRGCV